MFYTTRPDIPLFGDLVGLGEAIARLAIEAWKVIVSLVAGLVILGALGVSIMPVVTTLGITRLAVSLALQDTLSNFFAGLHLLVERPTGLGDFIKLETGQAGFIENI